MSIQPRDLANADAATSQSAVAIDMTKPYELAVVEWEGNPVKCIYLNDYRIVGGKPWGGSSRMRTFTVTLKDLAEAIPELRSAIDRALAGGAAVHDAPDSDKSGDEQ